jgi:hypothetical protein
VLFLEGELRRRGTDAFYGTDTDQWRMPTIEHIPAFHRRQIVPPADQCYECDGTGWLLHVTAQNALAERTCPLCGGTGSWRQAEVRSGHPQAAFHRIPPGFPHATAPSRPTRRSGVPGIVRTIVGYPLFMGLAYVLAQPVYFVTGSSAVATLLPLLLALAVAPAITRLVFGPLRNEQILGPLWILVVPIYMLAAMIFVCSVLTTSDALGTLAGKTLVGALSARHSLSDLPLGR